MIESYTQPSGLQIEKPKKNQALATFLLILTTVLWGSTFIVTKTAVAMVPTHFYMGVRFLIAAISFLPFYKKFGKIKKKDILVCFISGFLYWSQSVAQSIGLQTTTASKSGFITVLNIIIVPIVMAIFFKEKVSRNLWIGVIFAILGTAFLSFYGQNGLDGFVIGDVWTLGCALFCALYLIHVDRHVGDMDIFFYSGCQIFFVSLISFTSSIFLDDWDFILGDGRTEIISLPFLYIVLYVGIVATSGALLTQNYGQARVKATKAAVIFAFEPVFAALFGILFGGELLTTGLGIGAVLIFIGVIVSQIKPKRKGKKEV